MKRKTKRNRHAAYEKAKQKLQQLHLTQEQYQAAIRDIARQYKV